MQFEDKEGTVWPMRVDWAAIRRSRAANCDLCDELILEQIIRGGSVLIDALWAVLEPIAGQAKIAQTVFESRIRGEVWDQARDALMEGLEDFFPPQKVEILKAIQKEFRETVETNLKKSAEAYSDLPEKSEGSDQQTSTA